MKDYVIPSLRVIVLAHQSVCCLSNGETENYDTQDIWGYGDDNE